MQLLEDNKNIDCNFREDSLHLVNINGELKSLSLYTYFW